MQLWCLCCIMMFTWINEQPGIKKFWNWYSQYQLSRYLWLNITIWLILHVGLKQRSMCGKSGHLSIFTSLKHLMMLLKSNFFSSGLHFYTLSKPLIACGDMQLRFLKVITLLNTAFNFDAVLVDFSECHPFFFWRLVKIIHKKDRDFHRDLNTEICLRLFRQAEISRWSPSGMILVTELRMPDIKHCPCFDTLAWNDGIENTKIICSTVHTSAAMQIIVLIPK